MTIILSEPTSGEEVGEAEGDNHILERLALKDYAGLHVFKCDACSRFKLIFLHKGGEYEVYDAMIAGSEGCQGTLQPSTPEAWLASRKHNVKTRH